MSLSSSSSAISPSSSSLQQQTMLQPLIDFIKSSNISDWQRELDGTASELAARQEESESGRRKLVDQSKEFRQVASEDVRKTVSPLFKSFQAEVDNLSRRSRLAEAAFLSVYKRVIGIPDLYPLFEHIQTLTKRTQRSTDLELENKQLRETLDAYNSELGEVRNQEYTIRSLKEKVKQLEEGMESKVQSQVREREAELTRKFADKERQSDESVQEAVRRQLESEHRFSTLQSSLSATQAELLEAKNKLDERSAAQSSEMEMLLGELDKTNERAASAEMEVVRLREQLRASQSGEKTSDDSAEDQTGVEGLSETERLRNELCAREKEISRLLEDVHRLQSSLNALRVQTAEQVRNHERELSNKSAQLSTAELRLKEQNDYDEIRRELEILKSIEFGGLSQSQSSGDGASVVSLSQPVEILFAEKNKSLQSTVVQLRTANDQLQRDLDAAIQRAKTAESSSSNGTKGHAVPASSNHKINSNGGWSGMSSPSSALPDTSSPMPSSAASVVGATTNSTNNNYPISFSNRSPAVGASVAKRGFANVAFPEDATSSPQSPLVGASGAVNLSTNGPTSFSNGYLSPSGDELDTCTLAMQVREMLLANSIGQRLFAKHVLNLSQGTVSELLSKPKPWRKLTEKGKESYRRMAAWISNPNSLQELKELAPRKGPPGASSFPKPNEDVETEQKISKILEEAREEMMREQDYHEYDGQNGSGRSSFGGATPNSAHQGNNNQPQLNALSNLADQHKSLRDIARYVAGVQRQELVKLMQAADKNGNSEQRAVYSEEIAKLDDRIRLIDTMPSELLTNLGLSSTPSSAPQTNTRPTPSPFAANQSAASRGTPLFSANKPTNLSSANKNKPPPPVAKFASPSSKPFDLSVSSSNLANGGSSPFPLFSFSDSLQDSSSTNTPLPAHQSSFPSKSVLPVGASSIAASSAAAASSSFSKPALPPISQEDVDKYAELSTELLVKRVKNLLAQYGISQRLFGEQTLGLSQGSVSDMLSRPKPWSQLTHKGREPFIRMAIFLDDPHAIHKLARKECAECYMSSFTPFHGTTSLSGKGEPFESSAVASPAAASPMSGDDQSVLTSSSLIRPSASPLPAHGARRPSLAPAKVTNLSTPGNGSGSGFDLRNAFELNTEAVAHQIKDVLSRHGIGQKVFAEQVLGMSQGSVSDLLNRPKPWTQLTLKGREPYIRMFLWLYDPVLAAQLLPPPRRIADAAAAGAGSLALQQPFVLPGLGAETAQAAVLAALVTPQSADGQSSPESAQAQISAFFNWLQEQQMMQGSKQASPPLQGSIAFPGAGSMSSSSSFDRQSGSTPPPAHFTANRSTSSTGAANFSSGVNGKFASTKHEPVDLSEGLSPAFVVEQQQPSPMMADETSVVSQVPSFRPSKRKSANPSKRIANPSSPFPPVIAPAAAAASESDGMDATNDRPWNLNASASENGSRGAAEVSDESQPIEKLPRLSVDVCRSPTPSSVADAPASQTPSAVDRLHRGLTSDDVGWDGEEDDGDGNSLCGRRNGRTGLIDRLERNCLPGATEITNEPVACAVSDWDQ